ncbi:hypothetical protein [Paracoccus kondratievae]|uniref:Uncharacterized protein n=1 Tax=Paracoccus kondratievae TaxID=135740 RepID=A0AAD3RV03_9RHOB|nr:hypothetical protein [Paracoccus kondratievae]GLK65189.1 hypothetical protein GCM10017635_26630 [Paracoccus kondratievae]
MRVLEAFALWLPSWEVLLAVCLATYLATQIINLFGLVVMGLLALLDLPQDHLQTLAIGFAAALTLAIWATAYLVYPADQELVCVSPDIWDEIMGLLDAKDDPKTGATVK